MSQRLKLIEQLLLPNANVTAICESFNISRKTAYKWLSRYQEMGAQGLSDQSKEPTRQPNKVSETIETLIVSTHKEYPYWGPRKLRDYLLNVEGHDGLPSHTTFERVLKRNHCEVIKNNRSHPATTRFEREAANDLWQMDFKGSFMTGQHRCYPLTILDDYSRFSVALKACNDEKGQTVKSHLTAVFSEFGMPKQINVDNGNPWGASDLNSFTSIQVWLMKLGIRLTHSAPFHPQTNGKDERFHRTLKLEVLHERNYSKHEIQKVFDDWRHKYNFKRPHQALDGKTPGHRYQPSSRKFIHDPVPYDYQNEKVRKVQFPHGTILLKGKRYIVGKAFCREHVAIKETAQPDEVAIFFMDNFIKKIKLQHEIR